MVIRPELETRHHAAAVTTHSKAVRALHGTAARNLFVSKHGAAPLGTIGAPRGVWGAAVRLVALGATEATLTRSSALIDAVADHLPRGLARRLIALQVEGAAEAGRARPHRAQRAI